MSDLYSCGLYIIYTTVLNPPLQLCSWIVMVANVLASRHVRVVAQKSNEKDILYCHPWADQASPAGDEA